MSKTSKRNTAKSKKNSVISINENINTFKKAAKYIHKNMPRITLALLAPVWVYPTHIMKAFTDVEIECDTVVFEGIDSDSTEVLALRDLQDIMNDKYGMDKTIAIVLDSSTIDRTSVQTVQDRLKILKKVASDAELIELLRSTSPSLHKGIAEYSYSMILKNKDKLGLANKAGKLEYQDTFRFDSIEDLYTLLVFMREKNRANINIMHRVLESMRFYNGKNWIGIDELAGYEGPAELLSINNTDEYTFGDIKITKTNEFPSEIWQRMNDDEKALCAKIESPTMNMVYIGRTAVASSYTNYWEDKEK